MIPLINPDPQSVSRQMRINVDILKQEITDHINNELDRFKKELDYIRESRNDN